MLLYFLLLLVADILVPCFDNIRSRPACALFERASPSTFAPPEPLPSQHAGFDSNFEKSYPTADTQNAFLKAYVRAVKVQDPGTTEKGVGNGPTQSPHADEEAFVEALRTEVNRWALPSHLWWSAWAVVQARYSSIDFDFVDYARLRLAGYRLHKAAFFGFEEERPKSEEFFDFKGQRPS